MGGSGGYRRLPGGSDDFSLKTHTQPFTPSQYIYRHRDQHHQHHEYLKGEKEKWRSGELRPQPAELSLRWSRSSAG